MRLRRAREPLCAQARPRWPATRARTASSFGGRQHVRIQDVWFTGTHSRNVGTAPATVRISRLTDRYLMAQRLRRYRNFNFWTPDTSAVCHVFLQWMGVLLRRNLAIGAGMEKDRNPTGSCRVQKSTFLGRLIGGLRPCSGRSLLLRRTPAHSPLRSSRPTTLTRSLLFQQTAGYSPSRIRIIKRFQRVESRFWVPKSSHVGCPSGARQAL